MINQQKLIQRTLRVPRTGGEPGAGAGVARQMDAVLAGAGFKASRELLEYLSGLEPRAAKKRAVRVIGAVRELVGDHVAHNAYFVNFPKGVPDTVEFWVRCLRDALTPGTDATGNDVLSDAQLMDFVGWVNLLALPKYGRYQHTYAELLAAHDELIPSVKDRVTIVHLGGTLEEEIHFLYMRLAASTTPLSEADMALLTEMAAVCVEGTQPDVIPVRENRAVINAARLARGLPLVVIDTVTDVLRLACQVSGGDVSLVVPTRFRSLARRERRILLAALDAVIGANSAKLADVGRYAGRWKRLGELLHPHEYPQFPHAREVFAVARGEKKVRSLASRVERAFTEQGTVKAAGILSSAPGLMLRSVDRLLRETVSYEVDAVLGKVESVLGSVSGRVLCSVRDHIANRATVDGTRVFTTKSRRAWVRPDTRMPLPYDVINRTSAILDAELIERLPAYDRLVVDPAVLDVALPLSGKSTEDGFAVLPRGSRTRQAGDRLRFFMYWRQSKRRTDYDLSALLLDKNFEFLGEVSWTNYKSGDVVYSGDITEAGAGATEFIDIPLGTVQAAYVVPQVNIYDGEGFDQVAESMFGWMIRGDEQQGAPFEPRTVRTRSEMRGPGRVALPMVFGRDHDGSWFAKWMHLYLMGEPRFNQVEYNRVSTSKIARGIVDRDYLTMSYLVDLLSVKAGSVTTLEPGMRFDQPVVFLGLDRPDGLPEGSTAITRDNLNQLIPQ
ncbi:MAG: TerD family protein [Kibdelosporangium sp.]